MVLLMASLAPKLLLFFTASMSLHSAATQESTCCSLATGSCRSACAQMPLVTIAADVAAREARLADINNFCTPQLANFWQCFNSTLEEIVKGENWSGRACCPLPQSERCQLACVTAASRQDLIPSCRQSDELAFFTCLDRQEVGEDCCANARTPECQTACKNIFKTQLTPSREARTALNDACNVHSPKVLLCVKDYTHVTPAINSHKYLKCCEKARISQCRESCRRILRTKTTDQEIVDSLQEDGCGPPLPHDDLWQCFLQNSGATAEVEVSRIDRMGMDSAKLHCCYKAVSSTCRRLCLKTFFNEWTRSWDDFNRDCLSQLSEDSLVHCIDEVEEPCELGCEGLSYCTNFNNRPTELFRSCNRRADDAAHYDVELWRQQGTLGLPKLQLPVRNISSCSPLSWKAVACTLQIRPCQPHSHANRICSEDCYELLSQCMDWTRMPRGHGHTAASLCALLSPDNPNTPCISLKPFLEPSKNPYRQPQDEVTLPCKGDNPCNSSEVCSVNHNCAPGRPCLPYQCTPGCKLGEVSQYMVPQGTFVRLPQAVGLKDCPKICQCASHGIVERCQPLPCFHFDPCHLGSRKISHNSWFYMDCNMCSCYSGEITCRKKQCEEIGQDSSYTSLPCKCPPHHVPVCGRNGNTYPSSCLAKCAGLTDVDFEFGPCSSKDPCERVKCTEGQRCVPARRVCLSLQYKTCQQHQCVDVSPSCSSVPHDPVCDADGEEHPNMCYLLLYGKSLAYRGPCLVNCGKNGPVCGVNGNTYLSECAASADYVSVDYYGPCVAVGFISDQATPQCSDAGVQCPPLVQPGCIGITPPGACCPVCAGALRFLYSQKQVDRVLYALKGGGVNALTVGAVLRALERQVQVAECVVRGYLTVELDLFVLVQAVGKLGGPSELQLEACIREAEKLASLVQRTSPRVLSELSLSVLTTAITVHVSVTDAASSLCCVIWTLIITFTSLRFLSS